MVGHPPFFDENPFGLYKKILSGTISFPRKGLSRQAQSVISQFLNSNRARRLGCTSSPGIQSLAGHPFFAGVDWDSANKKLVVPPYLPAIGVEGETSNFDHYAEETIEEFINLTDKDRLLFEQIDQILDRTQPLDVNTQKLI